LQTGNLNGFARGYAAGMIPNDLGFGDAYLRSGTANISIGIARDSIRGAIVSGKDGIVKGIQFGQFNNAIGHVAGFVASGFSAPRFMNGAFIYEQAGSFRMGGLTMGNVVQYSNITTSEFGDSDYLQSYFRSAREASSFLLNHELAHIPQSNFLGALYLPIHGAVLSTATVLSGRTDGHHSRFNPLECSSSFISAPDKLDCR
jgi:hypothetical protein